MRLSTALKYALKYHTMAFVPTLIGALIVAGAVWFGVGQYVLDAVQSAGGSPTALLSAVVNAVLNSASPLLVVGGVIVGYFVRRVGKTALLVRANAQAVETARTNATDEVNPTSTDADGADAAVETPPATDSVETSDPANTSDSTESIDGGPVESDGEPDTDTASPGDATDTTGTSSGDGANDDSASGGFDDTWAKADEADEASDDGDRDDRQ